MIAPNTLLQNRYLVSEQVAQGGMGAVYVATDQRFNSVVALKETFFDDPGLRRAFEREAHLLNRLRHPALPKVSDHFIEGDGQFLVMEFIPGKDLAELLVERGTAFPLADVLAWGDELLDALDYLHTQEQQPIVHRDIKPQNLKLTPRGHIVLLDFGLAKGMPLHLSRAASVTASVFGYSRNYAPLEQIQGSGTDVRSDLYSLGATLYHLMTGVTPPDALTRATAVLNAQPDPLRPANEVESRVPARVAEALTRAMSQNAAGRPQTAAAMRAELRRAGRETQIDGATETNIIASPAAAAAPASPLSEQETQLFGAQADTAMPHASAGTVFALEEGQPPPSGETTMVNNSARTPDELAAAASRRTVAVEEAAGTKLMSGAARGAQGKSAWPRRLLGLAAGLVLLVAVAAAAFTFARLTAQTNSEPAAAQTNNAAPSSSQPASTKTQPAPNVTQPTASSPVPAATPRAATATTAATGGSGTARTANRNARRESERTSVAVDDDPVGAAVQEQLKELDQIYVVPAPDAPGGLRQRGVFTRLPPNFNTLPPEEQRKIAEAFRKARELERERLQREGKRRRGTGVRVEEMPPNPNRRVRRLPMPPLPPANSNN